MLVLAQGFLVQKGNLNVDLVLEGLLSEETYHHLVNCLKVEDSAISLIACRILGALLAKASDLLRLVARNNVPNSMEKNASYLYGETQNVFTHTLRTTPILDTGLQVEDCDYASEENISEDTG